MRYLRYTVLVIAIVLVAALAYFWTPSTDPNLMRTKYGSGMDQYARTAEGMNVHYRASGPTDAPVLIMIHGTAASLHTWEPLRQRLDDRYRVIAYDQPGHGLTGPHPERNYDYSGMVDGLDAVFVAEGISEAVLIGNSMGGWVAWQDALENPHRVTSLVLLNAVGIPSDEELNSALGFKIMASPIGRMISQRVTPRSLVEQSVYDAIEREEIITTEMVDRYWELLRYPGNRQAMGDMFARRPSDPSGELAEIEQPTLVLWGDQDQLVPVSSAYEFERRMPNAEAIVYEGVGHLPMEEVPGAVAQDILDFLGD